MTNTQRCWPLCISMLVFCLVQRARAVEVSPAEQAAAHLWVEAKLDQVAKEPPPEPGLIVLANYSDMVRNGADGQPLTISDKQYKRGLYCHAPSRILVQLPGPGATFTSMAGIDMRGRFRTGSVEFIVGVHGEEAFHSQVSRRGDAPIPVKADLGGARQFVIVVKDAGGNMHSDQADWADAKVTLADGKEVYLGDLPIIQKHLRLLNTDIPFSFTYDGKPSSQLLKTWPMQRATQELDEARTQYTLTWKDPATHLEVQWVAIEYKDFPTVEWTVHFTNRGSANTPILSNIQGLDTRFERGAENEFVLHHNKGVLIREDDYEPLTTPSSPSRRSILLRL